MKRRSTIVAITLLGVIATLGFRGSLDGWGFLAPSALGALVAAGSLVVATRRRLYVGESVAMSTGCLVVFGGVATRGLPTPESYADFFAGIVGGWSHLLSSSPPTELTAPLRALPYVVAWASVTIGTELSRRTSQPTLPVIGPVAGMITTILVSSENSQIAAAAGAAMALGAVVLGLVQQQRPQRRAVTFGLITIVAVAAPFVGPRLPLASANDRFDLRDHQGRPWDPLSEPSPLVTFKASLKEGRSDKPVFTVTADEPLTRWSTAVLAHHNGTVWTVADERTDAPAEFEPVDRWFPGVPDGASVAYTIDVAEPTLWIPTAGWPTTAQTDTELRFNAATGTTAAPARLWPGSDLAMTAVPRSEPTTTDLLAATATGVDPDDLELVSPAIRNLAGDIFQGVDAGPARVLTLADRFTLRGFYDHGPDSRPGHSLGRLAEFLGDPDRLVGYGEQYAASAGILARLGGVSARVVVGYRIPESRYVDGRAVVVADDRAAWIEIETLEFGWVPIDVTPDRAREPQTETPGVTITDVAVPNPPPPPPAPPESPAVSLIDSDDDELDEMADDPDHSDPTGNIPAVVLIGSTAVGFPGVVLLLLGSIVLVAKERRRRRRLRAEPGPSIVGAWRELLDGFSEAGVVPHPSTTPDEVVRTLLSTEPSTGAVADDLRQLAAEVDRAAFHPRPADADAASAAWAASDRVVTALRSSRSRRRRWLMRTDPRPLLRKGRP